MLPYMRVEEVLLVFVSFLHGSGVQKTGGGVGLLAYNEKDRLCLAQAHHRLGGYGGAYLQAVDVHAHR